MRTYDQPYAGLILPDERGLDIAPYLDACQQVLARLDPRPVGVPKRSARRQAVLGDYYGLRVQAQPDSPFGPRILIELITRDGETPDEEKAARILSDTVLAALHHSPADTIEWYSPDTLMDTDDFIRLRNYVSPHREAAPALPQDTAVHAVEELLQEQSNYTQDDQLDAPDEYIPSEEQLATRDLRALLSEPDDVPEKTPYNPLERLREKMETKDAEEIRMGTAGWMMSGLLAVICFPMAVVVWITSLRRGMDFRLTTQVLSVTMLFVALQNSSRLHLMLDHVLR